MELSKQVCSLRLARKLRELGVKQESLFYWYRLAGFAAQPQMKGHQTVSKEFGEAIAECSAYTVAELGEMLPWKSKKMGTVNNAELVFTKLQNSERKTLWNVAYWDEDKDLYPGMVVRIENYDNEADARAQMLIYLLENNLLVKE